MIRNEKLFDVFDNYYEGDSFVYLPLFIEDPSKDLHSIFDFFFSEDTIYNHFKKNNDALFSNTTKCKSLLYRNLLKFLDQEIIDVPYDFSDCSDEIKKIIEEEESIFNSFNIRKDKVGKIGEYLCSIILEKIFAYTCIIPKTDLITSKNMSVYGIDTLHYDGGNNIILFGESKFTNSLKNGIMLISESLKKYEKRINDEIELIFTQRLIDSLNVPTELFKDAVDTFIDVRTFIAKTGIKEICVPLFITHGTETKPDEILQELKMIKRSDFLGLTTKYLVISMPIQDAKAFIEYFTISIKAKSKEYEEELRNGQ